MGRGGVGRPPKSLPSRGSSQESDGENSGGSNTESASINLLQAPSILSASPYPSRSSTSGTSHNSSYVAPQWLLDKKTAKFFSVPISGAPKATLKALERHLGKSDGGALLKKRAKRKSNKLFAQIKSLQEQLVVQNEQAQWQVDQVAKATATKETKMNAIRKQQKAKMDAKLKQLEDLIVKERDVKIQAAEEATRKSIREEFEVNFEAQEQARKRKRQEEEEAGASKSESKEGDRMNEATEDGDCESSAKKEKLGTELIQEQIDAANTKTESLTQMKTEMIWLMKQVIKAEMKQKLLDPRKKEAS